MIPSQDELIRMGRNSPKSQIVLRGRGTDNLSRLPALPTRHRGKLVPSVRGLVMNALKMAGKEFNYPWQDLKWAIGRDLDIHVYPPLCINIRSINNG